MSIALLASIVRVLYRLGRAGCRERHRHFDHINLHLAAALVLILRQKYFVHLPTLARPAFVALSTFGLATAHERCGLLLDTDKKMLP